MRKIFIILTLIVSSFFVFNSSVKADIDTYIVSSSTFDYINEDFFIIREKAIEYCNENNMYYLITKEDTYRAYIFEKGDYNITKSFTGYTILNLNTELLIYKNIDGEFTFFKSISSNSFLLRESSNNINYFYYLDTNIENLLYTSSSSFNILYNDLLYEVTKNSVFPTVYQIYLDENYVEPEPEPEDPHLEEKEILSNFYIMVITKIGELANSVFNNYILLFVIGIFILIFVFKLIFRRLL